MWGGRGGVQRIFSAGDAGVPGGLPAQGGGALVALMETTKDHREETEGNADDEQEIVGGHGCEENTNNSEGGAPRNTQNTRKKTGGLMNSDSEACPRNTRKNENMVKSKIQQGD